MSNPVPDQTSEATPRQRSGVPWWRGLTFRQAAITLLVVVVLGLLAGAIELRSDWQAMRGEIRANTERTLRLVQGPAAEAAYQFNEALAAQVVDSLFAFPEMQQVVLRDNFGSVITERLRPTDSQAAGTLVTSLFGDLSAHHVRLDYAAQQGKPTEVGHLEVALDPAVIAASFMQRGSVILILGLIKALVISLLVVLLFYFMITRPLLALHSAITRINPVRPGDWPRPQLAGHAHDELGQIVGSLDELMHAFQRGLEQRDQARDENTRLGAELDVSRRIQEILLPSQAELDAVDGLQIATFMEPASEVGGDYYDVLPNDSGGVRIGIGDVTGHGLESGVVMLMTQSAVRTMLTSAETDIVRVMEVLNSTIYNNVQRMGCGKNLTLALLDYHPAGEATEATETAQENAARGRLRISGQHESVIVARADGRIEVIDTDELGFPIGLVEEMAEFVSECTLQLHAGDTVVLYTDGITEAADPANQLYGLERLLAVIQQHHRGSAEAIKQAIVADVKRHIGTQTLHDDLTLVILKQK